MSEPGTTHEPRKLGLVGKALVALMVVLTAGLVVGGAFMVRAKRIEDEKRRQTAVVLADLRKLAKFNLNPLSVDTSGDFTGQVEQIETLEPDDVAGQVKLRREASRDAWVCITPGLCVLSRGEHLVSLGNACKDILGQNRQVVLDAWSHPIYYRCPGPIHESGWDLISCGPNGVYEEGAGDDIVVGEDLPGGLASIESGR